jgi:hypothetical protein
MPPYRAAFFMLVFFLMSLINNEIFLRDLDG